MWVQELGHGNFPTSPRNEQNKTKVTLGFSEQENVHDNGTHSGHDYHNGLDDDNDSSGHGKKRKHVPVIVSIPAVLTSSGIILENVVH